MKKLVHILKAIASGLIWGLGQAFNKQFIKATMFFVLFVGVVGLEIGTSHYFSPRKYDIYEHYNGEYFHDSDVRGSAMESFIGEYCASLNKALKNESTDFEIDDQWISILLANNIISERTVVDGERTYVQYDTDPILVLTFDADFLIQTIGERVRSIYDAHILYDEYGRVVHQNKLTQTVFKDGAIVEEYVKETIIYNGVEVEVDAYDESSKIMLDFQQRAWDEAIEYATINQYEETDARDSVKRANTTLTAAKATLEAAKLALDELTEGTEEYNAQLAVYNKALADYQGAEINYKETYDKEIKIVYSELRRDKYNQFYNDYFEKVMLEDSFLSLVINSFKNISKNGGLGPKITLDDWSEMMARIYFAAFPEEYEELSEKVDAYWNENGGFFGKGIWAVLSLGKSPNVSLSNVTQMQMFCPVSPVEQTLEVHHSVNLLLYGIVTLIVLAFVLVFYAWNVRDAYKTSVARAKEKAKAKEDGRKPVYQTEKEYFHDMYEECFPYIFLTPAVILMAFITIMPIIFSLLIAFTNYDKNHIPPGQVISWVGLENFGSLLNFSGNGGIPFGDAFWKVLCWTLIWAVGSTFTCFFGGFIQAIVVNNERVIFRKFWRTILILPWAVPALVSQMMFKLFFDSQNGAMNVFLKNIGVTDFLTKCGLIVNNPNKFAEIRNGNFVDKFFFLGTDNIQWYDNIVNPWLPRIFIIVLNIWLGFPYFMAMMSGIMTSISKDLYEAAEIDGATKFQQFQKITVPLVLYSTAPLLIMSFSSNFNNFGVIYFVTGGGYGTSDQANAFAGNTDILISWIYNLTTTDTNRWYSMASVFSILIFLVVASISTYNFLQTKSFKEEDMI